jgi:hypothetical protein
MNRGEKSALRYFANPSVIGIDSIAIAINSDPVRALVSDKMGLLNVGRCDCSSYVCHSPHFLSQTNRLLNSKNSAVIVTVNKNSLKHKIKSSDGILTHHLKAADHGRFY